MVLGFGKRMPDILKFAQNQYNSCRKKKPPDWDKREWFFQEDENFLKIHTTRKDLENSRNEFEFDPFLILPVSIHTFNQHFLFKINANQQGRGGDNCRQYPP